MSGYDDNGPSVIIDGEALRRLQATILSSPDPVYKVSIDRRKAGIAYKINERMWTGTIPTDTPQEV